MMSRFWSKVSVNAKSGCWEWQAFLTPKGYGQFSVKGRMVRAHRFAYEWMVGPITEGMELDHLCRNRRCVNPDHLEPVTHRENVLRGDLVAATKKRFADMTHCGRGHALSGANVYVRRNGKGECRECRRIRRRAARLRRRGGM